MVALSTFFLLAGAGFSVAQQFAQLVPRDLSEREVASAGGWSLQQGVCPESAPLCGSDWCCPASLTCVHTGGDDIAEACCPGNTTCIPAFKATPFCADDTWTLWNATMDTEDNAGYFCCLPGQIGLQTGDCVDGGTDVAATLSAVLLIPAVTTGEAATAATASSVHTESTESGSGPSTVTVAPSSGGSGGTSATANVVTVTATGATPTNTKSGAATSNLASASFSLIAAIALFITTSFL